MNKKRTLQTIRNEHGLITLDFMFALMMCIGFSVVFFAISITLSMVEVTQYIAFASARSYSSAHETPGDQEATGNAKYKELLQNKVFKGLYSLKMITIPPAGSPVVGDYNDQFMDVQTPADDNNTFTGSQVSFKANILNFQVPFLGATAEESTTGQATISAYLIREVSSQECRESFNRARYLKLKGLRSEYQRPQTTPDAFLVTDNGC